MPSTKILIVSPPPAQTYFYGPFRLESEIEIPELRDLSGPGERLVIVRAGGVPQSIPDAEATGTAVQLTASEYLLTIPGIARYYVANGNEVRVETEPGVPSSDVSTYLLGSVFGALCHQNRLLPLHASAVVQDERVTAFLGDSGAGKSTLAACLNRRGYTVVSDDICLIDPSNPANPRVIPVAGWLKLWNQSLEHLGQAADERHRVFSTDDKYRVHLPPSSNTTRGLARIFFLDRTESPEAVPSLTRMAIPEAVAALMDMTYAVYIPVLSGQQPRLFRDCAALLGKAEAYRLTRPWSLERTDEVLDLLEREVLSSRPGGG
jgi:hypothetical protein